MTPDFILRMTPDFFILMGVPTSLYTVPGFIFDE
jgi:hypothetical protein